MSFTLDIINELTLREREQTCCKKALLFGLFFAAERISRSELVAEFKTQESAELAALILKKQFTAEPTVEAIVRAGRKMYHVTVSSKALSIYIERLDRGEITNINELDELIGFRCKECRKAFLAGVFIVCGLATDPKKRYSIEFCSKSEIRAATLSTFLCANIGEPRCVDRRSRIGLYYRGNEQIADILAYMGAFSANFAVVDAFFENELKNNENRATNCALKNIEKSVAATRRQIDAIELLKSSGRFDLMSEELKYTANLRCENDLATLAELAALHEPSISKSGLNRRLEKIVAFAYEV